MSVVRVTHLVHFPFTQLTLEYGNVHYLACENTSLVPIESERVESLGVGLGEIGMSQVLQLIVEVDPVHLVISPPPLLLCLSDRMTFSKRGDSFFKGIQGADLPAGTLNQFSKIISRSYVC